MSKHDEPISSTVWLIVGLAYAVASIAAVVGGVVFCGSLSLWITIFMIVIVSALLSALRGWNRNQAQNRETARMLRNSSDVEQTRNI